MRSILSLILSLVDILFASRLFEASSLGGAFCYFLLLIYYLYTDNVRKNITGVFIDIGFSLEIETNRKKVNFLDVSLIIITKIQTIDFFYIHSLSNHSPNLLKQISNSIHKRLSKNSSNEEICNTAKCEYEDSPKKIGFKVDFKYPKNQQQKPKNRSRNIVWFNPPFNKAISTTVAKMFLRLINRHFSKSHRLHKMFSNRNTAKVSYSCMQNMSKIIQRT